MIKQFDKYRNFLLGASLLVMVVLIGSLLYLNMGGQALGGLSKSGSLEATDLKTLDYPNRNPGHLACDPVYCPGSVADRPLITFPATEKQLRDALVNMVDTNPRLDFRSLDIMQLLFDVTVRTRGKTFPDLVTIQIVSNPQDPSKAMMAIYSRSVIGSPDPVKDAERVQDWIKQLSEKVTP